MAKENAYNIQVEIADRNYPLTVNNEEQASVVELAKQLNLEINEMHSRYANKLSKQDVLAMLLLTYAKKLKDLETVSNAPQLEEKLDALYLLLEEAF